MSEFCLDCDYLTKNKQLYAAIQNNHLDCIKYYFKCNNKYPLPHNIYNSFSLKTFPKILEYFQQNHPDIIIYYFVKTNQIDRLESIFKNKINSGNNEEDIVEFFILCFERINTNANDNDNTTIQFLLQLAKKYKEQNPNIIWDKLFGCIWYHENLFRFLMNNNFKYDVFFKRFIIYNNLNSHAFFSTSTPMDPFRCFGYDLEYFWSQYLNIEKDNSHIREIVHHISHSTIRLKTIRFKNYEIIKLFIEHGYDVTSDCMKLFDKFINNISQIKEILNKKYNIPFVLVDIINQYRYFPTTIGRKREI